VSSAPANPARDGADVDQARGVGQILFMLYRATEMRTWQVQEARRQFRELFDNAVEKGPQRVTRNGRGAVIVLSEEEWRRLSEAVPSSGNCSPPVRSTAKICIRTAARAPCGSGSLNDPCTFWTRTSSR